MTRSACLVAGIVAAMIVPGEAAAFCRSTTCREVAKGDCPKDADDCPATGARLFWATSCVSWAMNRNGTQDLDPDDTRAAIRRSFFAWTDVTCPGGGIASMTFAEREPVSCKRSEFDRDGRNLNVVLFQDDDWKYRGVDATIAKTSVTFSTETGEIFDADIEVNTANNTMVLAETMIDGDFDLQSVLTHEIGHFIGLAHSNRPGAIMLSELGPGTLRRTLTPDDVAAICAVYPPDRKAACNAEPRGGFRDTCDDDATAKSCAVASVGGESEAPRGIGALLALGVAMVGTRLFRRRNGAVTRRITDAP